MIGFWIGSLMGLIIALTPPVLVAIRKSCPFKLRMGWFLATLIIPCIATVVAGVIVTVVQGNTLPYGLAPLIPLSWYVSAWGLYLIFRKKYPKIEKIEQIKQRNYDIKKPTKIWKYLIPISCVLVLLLCHDIIITHALAWWFCRSAPNPKTFVVRKVAHPGSIYFEDNVYPGYDEDDRLNTITNYLDGVDVTTLALNDPEGNVHVYTADKDAWRQSAARETRKNNEYVKFLEEETKSIAAREEIYSKTTMPKMNYTVLFNPVSLPKFWLRYLWSDEMTITDNATGERLAYNRRLIRRFYMIESNPGFGFRRVFQSGALCGDVNYGRFNLKVFPNNVKINTPTHLPGVMPEPGFQSTKRINHQR